VVHIRHIGAKKQHCIIMLVVTADGQKLLPYVRFECKTVVKEKFCEGIIVQIQGSGLMTEDLVGSCVKSVWF
jgi:hypothetical protein